MSTPQEQAEAILIVLKRIMKYILGLILIIAIGFTLIIQYLEYKNKQEREERQKIEDQIVVVAGYPYNNQPCEKGYPYFYAVRNNSEKTLESVNFTLEIRPKGRSIPINSYTSFTEDKILQTGEYTSRCFSAISKDYSKPLTDNDVEIKVSYKTITLKPEK